MVVLNGHGSDEVESLRGRLITNCNTIPGLKQTVEKMQVIVLSEPDMVRLLGSKALLEQLSELEA